MRLPKIASLDLRDPARIPATTPSPTPRQARPVAAPRAVLGGILPSVSRVAGNKEGTLSNWVVSRSTVLTETRERRDISDRAEDLVNNDPHAVSTISGMAINISGTGFAPQSTLPADVLGISTEAAERFQRQAEWAWQVWAAEADAGGRWPFWGVQYLATWSLLCRGEFFRIPVMLPASGGRTFSLALQGVDPLRVYTPTDKLSDPGVRDGVGLGPLGQPMEYWVENPSRREQAARHGYLASREFARIRARIGHRPGILHGFVPREEEQVRGVSVLAPAMKFFKDLSDYLDFELVGAIVAASFPVAVETTNPYGVAAGLTQQTGTSPLRYYQELTPGQVAYLNPNEAIKPINAARPGDTFSPFVERLLRAVGAAAGIPYEVVARDFSKTNYSSARAALLEAWRVFQFYQRWLIACLCQPCWEMVIEEGWLRGMIEIPKGAPDFYAMRRAWCRAQWIPPKRGHVDPVKEMRALVEGHNAGFINLDTIAAEMGTDWETLLQQRKRESEYIAKLGMAPAAEETEDDDDAAA